MNGPFSIGLLNYQRVSINTNSQVASSKVSLQRGWSPTIILGTRKPPWVFHIFLYTPNGQP